MAIIFNGQSQGSGQMPLFNMEELIKDAISSMIMNRLSLRSMNLIKYVVYFPTYTICKSTQEKTLSSFYLRLKTCGEYTRIPVNEIEMSGATLVEFSDFLYEKGAKEVDTPPNVLEMI